MPLVAPPAQTVRSHCTLPHFAIQTLQSKDGSQWGALSSLPLSSLPPPPPSPLHACRVAAVAHGAVVGVLGNTQDGASVVGRLTLATVPQLITRFHHQRSLALPRIYFAALALGRHACTPTILGQLARPDNSISISAPRPFPRPFSPAYSLASGCPPLPLGSPRPSPRPQHSRRVTALDTVNPSVFVPSSLQQHPRTQSMHTRTSRRGTSAGLRRACARAAAAPCSSPLPARGPYST